MDASNPSSHSMENKGSDMRTRFMKRRGTLLHKAYEVSTLCDVDCCIIVNSPFNNEQVTWPPEREQVEKVIGRFQKMPGMERTRKMKTPENYYEERKQKLEEKLKKVQRENRRKEIAGCVSQWLAGHKDQGLSVGDLQEVELFMKAKLNVLSSRIEEMKKHVSPVEQPVVFSAEYKSKGVSPEEQPAADEMGSLAMMVFSGGQPGGGGDGASACLNNP